MTKVRSFMGAAQYLRKFIANFSIVAAPLHVVTTKGKSFHWGKRKPQQQAFEDLKRKISNAPILSMPNLQQPFEFETNMH